MSSQEECQDDFLSCTDLELPLDSPAWGTSQGKRRRQPTGDWQDGREKLGVVLCRTTLAKLELSFPEFPPCMVPGEGWLWENLCLAWKGAVKQHPRSPGSGQRYRRCHSICPWPLTCRPPSLRGAAAGPTAPTAPLSSGPGPGAAQWEEASSVGSPGPAGEGPATQAPVCLHGFCLVLAGLVCLALSCLTSGFFPDGQPCWPTARLCPPPDNRGKLPMDTSPALTAVKSPMPTKVLYYVSLVTPLLPEMNPEWYSLACGNDPVWLTGGKGLFHYFGKETSKRLAYFKNLQSSQQISECSLLLEFSPTK